jgi:hypothetical protein
VARTLIVLILVALIVPSAASARKNAWQFASLSGTYAYHATNSAATVCDPNSFSSGDGVVLKRDYAETFRADSFPSHQYAAKYFPFFGGPQTNGPGQKAHLIRQATISETYRVFTVDPDSGTCSFQDQTCTKAVTMKTARFLIDVTHKRFRYNGPLQIVWNLSLAPSIPDCTPRGHQGLDGGLLPSNSDGIPSQFKTPASKGQFRRKRSTFSINGSAGVQRSTGFTASIDYSARATLKKVVIADGCVDLHPQHAFVCSN